MMMVGKVAAAAAAAAVGAIARRHKELHGLVACLLMCRMGWLRERGVVYGRVANGLRKGGSFESPMRFRMAAMARNSISHGSALFFLLLVSPFLSAAKRNKRKEKKSKKDVIITNAHF
jgi:hypothetical protein